LIEGRRWQVGRKAGLVDESQHVCKRCYDRLRVHFFLQRGRLDPEVRSRASLELEIIALRHQVTVLWRQRPGRPQLSSLDRLLWVWLYRIWPQIIDAMVLVKPFRAQNSHLGIGGSPTHNFPMNKPHYDRADYSVVVKNRASPPKAWRWEIYRAGNVGLPRFRGEVRSWDQGI
jgi:hypothetical protein